MMRTRWVATLAVAGLAVVGLALGLAAFSGTARADDAFGPIEPPEFDAKKAELGKRLFFDVRLSGDAAISCASCHSPEKGYSDGLTLSKAYPGSDGFRNSPTLINAALKNTWFHDGRMGTNLNDVTREMITETYLMNMDMRLMQERLKQDPVYVQMFEDAGYGEPSNGSVRKAIPEYLKTVVSRNAPYDLGTMSDDAHRGFEVFKGKGGCAACHTGVLFSDDKAHNTGVPENTAVFANPLRHVTYLTFGIFQGLENSYNLRRDVGAHIRTRKADRSDYGTFMTPSLRELNYTAPYMHNGMLASLEDVIAFYDAGGGSDPNKDPALKPLGLTDREKLDLIAFLKALSGDELTGPEHVWSETIPTDYPTIENWRDARN